MLRNLSRGELERVVMRSERRGVMVLQAWQVEVVKSRRRRVEDALEERSRVCRSEGRRREGRWRL